MCDVTPDNRKVARQRAVVDEYGRIEGPEEWVVVGDARGTVIARCALCGDLKKLVHGHIIPAWAERMMTEGVGVGTARNGRVKYEITRRHAEYLMCESCDNYVGEGERYLAHLCRGRVEDLNVIGASVQEADLTGLNTRLILRGLLGVLFKVHLSRSTIHSRDIMDESLANRLPMRLLHDDYPNHCYSATATKWMLNPKFPGFPRDSLRASIRRGHNSVLGRVTMGGVSFDIFLQNPHVVERFGVSRSYSLTPYGQWSWMVGGLNESFADVARINGNLEHLNVEVDEETFGSYREAFTSESSCPCDLTPSLPARECCAGGRWLPQNFLGAE